VPPVNTVTTYIHLNFIIPRTYCAQFLVLLFGLMHLCRD
jgi:hypothetical protein